MPRDETLHQRMMPQKAKRGSCRFIRCKDPRSWLCNFKIGFSPEAAKLLVREHGLDSLESLRVLTVNKQQECQWDAQQGAASLSDRSGEPESSHLLISSQGE